MRLLGITDEQLEKLKEISNNDPQIGHVVGDFIDHLYSTYSDKYEDYELGNFSKRILLSSIGKPANIFTAMKYIQRYLTSGYRKSNNPVDILKAIHFLFFELQRVLINERATESIGSDQATSGTID